MGHEKKKKCCKLAKCIGFKHADVKKDKCVCVIDGQRCLDVKATKCCDKKKFEIKSPLVHSVNITVEKHGKCYLNMVEIVLKDSEVNPLIHELVKRCFKITALHNHDLNVKPCIKYLHFTSTDCPKQFARKLRKAFKCAKDECTHKSILHTLK